MSLKQDFYKPAKQMPFLVHNHESQASEGKATDGGSFSISIIKIKM